MFFLNLSAGEFFALLGALGGLVSALYLLDRSKRKRVVSTLRFWTPARNAEQLQSRRRMREPWSLLLQLLGLLLLLLAIAQVEWGSKRWRGRDHVLLLDTSAWSASGIVLDEERRLARNYVASLPSADRVMLVRADALATPVTPFTANRQQFYSALAASQSQSSALNLDQALSFATQAQSWTEGIPGEIVYTGPGMTAAGTSESSAPRNLRVLTPDFNREHVGIRRLAATVDSREANSWNATITLRNFGSQRHAVRLNVQFAGTQFAPRTLDLAPHQETAVEYSFATAQAGDLVARVTPPDLLASDQTAHLTLPKNRQLEVVVYTRRPAELRPLFAANPRLTARFVDPARYSAQPSANVVVFDAFAPPTPPSLPTLWIAPPRQGSPIEIKDVDHDEVIKTWHKETALSDGLHAKETHIVNADVFELLPSDTPVASTAKGPIVVARRGGANHPRFAVIGFDPLQGQLKFEVTTPILFANLLRWLSPESFRTLDLTAGTVGTATIPLDPKEPIDQIRVLDENGLALPFTVRNGTLQLFAAEPSVLRVSSAIQERILSLTLPEVGEAEWKPPSGARSGVPGRVALAGVTVDLWRWLALAGLGCLIAEWILYGRERTVTRRATPNAARQRESELAAK